MKSSALALAFVAAISTIALPLTAADVVVCKDGMRGKPCTNEQGQASVCAYDDVCVPSIEECSSGSNLFQTCAGTIFKYCYPLPDSTVLVCQSNDEVVAAVKHNACKDKSDGATCTGVSTDATVYSTAGYAVVYTLDGVCQNNYCWEPKYASCSNASAGSNCTYRDVDYEKLQSFAGNCEGEDPYLASCVSSGSGTFISNAKALTAPGGSSASGSTPTPMSSSATAALSVTVAVAILLLALLSAI